MEIMEYQMEILELKSLTETLKKLVDEVNSRMEGRGNDYRMIE